MSQLDPKFNDLFQVAVFDMNSLSVVFFIDDVSLSKSPVISISWQGITNTHGLLKSPRKSEANILAKSAEEVLFILTKDSNINVIDGHTGKSICSRPWNTKKESIAISLYVIGKYIYPFHWKNKTLEVCLDSRSQNSEKFLNFRWQCFCF